MDAELKTQLSNWLTQQTGQPFNCQTASAASGGCIHRSYILADGKRSYFIKINRAAKLDVFEAEAAALEAIARSGTIRVPRPIGYDCIQDHSFLAMERLSFGAANADSWQRMGQQLAELHRSTNDQFGWARDNFIGSSTQHNGWSRDWADFFRERRLRPQFEMAQRAGLRFTRQEALLEAAHSLLAEHKPSPSLLHGDLWSGNAAFLADGTPVIYDPASYYGDREADLAFTEFFGGFPTTFYQAYQQTWPLPAGYAPRKTLYNLYHVLNHANLFGGGYISQAQTMIDSLIQTQALQNQK